ncbi:methyl-CpG-binding domain-containing protein 2-like isoform X1 [Typha angustifolia]|uniref:methyl-CpG-binding domain-containing protein 2-like isoform X1 n=1 Tax=Typha angustifolia TaxID=59011 RepID=UPI003C30C5EA
MQSNLEDVLPKPKKDISKSPRPSKKSRKVSIDVSEVDKEEDNYYISTEDASNQLVTYNPDANDKSQDSVAVTDNVENPDSSSRSLLPSNSSSRVLPSIGAFTVQCADCFKWRLIPTKEQYEEIRESILEEPFRCERAREWRPDISCEDPTDISQDGSRLWAIDKPNIAQPPPGWERLLRIRGEGSTKFADVYYSSPTGKKLRSMVEVQKYLMENPEYIRQGVHLSKFSFQIPKPLQENYVRKRTPHQSTPSDGANPRLPKTLEPEEVRPLSWAAPPTCRELQMGEQASLSSSFEAPPYFGQVERSTPPAKRKKLKTTPRKMQNSPVCDQLNIKLEDTPQSRNTSFGL